MLSYFNSGILFISKLLPMHLIKTMIALLDYRSCCRLVPFHQRTNPVICFFSSFSSPKALKISYRQVRQVLAKAEVFSKGATLCIFFCCLSFFLDEPKRSGASRPLGVKRTKKSRLLNRCLPHLLRCRARGAVSNRRSPQRSCVNFCLRIKVRKYLNVSEL